MVPTVARLYEVFDCEPQAHAPQVQPIELRVMRDDNQVSLIVVDEGERPSDQPASKTKTTEQASLLEQGPAVVLQRIGPAALFPLCIHPHVVKLE